ncbi:MAG: GntR family transcriptional regulator [Anaerolinea sp.]|nr:GntR family transcriptional regulator [Anaerolinea sp.]
MTRPGGSVLDRDRLIVDRQKGGPPVKGESLREQIVSSLRWAIFMGELPPGDHFSVPILAEQFGVSPTPVREAVLDLVQQGLVVALPNRGFKVVAPSMEYLRQAMQVRRLLEIPTMRAIAATVSPGEIEPIRRLADAILRFAQEGDLKHFVEADYEFHWQLTGLCGNRILTEVIEDLRSRARVVAIPAIARLGVITETAKEHQDLLTAMIERDLDAVERVTLAHMDRTFEGLKAAALSVPQS